MILAIDSGNTNIVVGIISNGIVDFSFRLSTDHTKTSDQYALEIEDRLKLHKLSPDKILGGIISSVVPPLSNILVSAVETAIGKRPLLLSPKLKTDLEVCIDNKKMLGSDLLASAVAARFLYPTPTVIVDMGTATTFTAIDTEGKLIGGAIMPGVRISLDALSARASQLPDISLEVPPSVIGTNTIDSMNSGIVFGSASMIDGMVERIECEIGARCVVVITGGLSRYIYPHCKTRVVYDEDLILKGLEIIYYKNLDLTEGEQNANV